MQKVEIPLEKLGGIYELPVKINGVLTLNFILDTGASEVQIPADVALTLFRTGTITQSDFLPGKFYELADGSIAKNSRLIIRELDLGVIKISQVPASVGPANGSLLLGQSFLGRLESWSLDNKRHVLIIGAGAVQPR
ncbi:MAG: retroviral-like aspartic protease family protein [Syntrophobacteraceae bacterium]